MASLHVSKLTLCMTAIVHINTGIKCSQGQRFLFGIHCLIFDFGLAFLSFKSLFFLAWNFISKGNIDDRRQIVNPTINVKWSIF